MSIVNPEDKGTWNEVIATNEAIEDACIALTERGLPLTTENIIKQINDPSVDEEAIRQWLLSE